MKIDDNGAWYFFCSFGSCILSNKEEINATEHIGNGDKVFHFLSAMLPCLVVVFSLILQVICSKMCRFLCTLSKWLCTCSLPHILIRVFISLVLQLPLILFIFTQIREQM